MALSTFGAIMGFAAEMVEKAGETYEALSEKARNPTFKASLKELAGEAAKHHSLMEKTRRENVTEMILEPITGLHEDDYGLELKGLSQTEDTDLLKIALLLEGRSERFFQDASSKVPLPEVARIFRKVGQKKGENLTRLQSLGLNQTLNRV